ncbi:MAG: Ig-like domain-containing protein, partial [Lachnospiraceae bacterium]|nr:Ig-like domain-containing protein [Lachnospiraceae bacterium]
MKKENNNNQYLTPENLEDTLEFLSLDDETIEEYNRTVLSQGRKTVKTSDPADDIEEDYDDEDIEDIEEYDGEDIEEYDDEDDEDIEEYEDIEDIEDIEYIEDFDEDYDEEDYYEDEDEDVYNDENSRRKGLIPRVIYFVKDMSSIDRVVAILGFFIIIAGIITGTLYVDAKSISKQVEAFAEIGSDIEGIGIIGESGLIAVSDAESARLSQMVEPEQEQEEEKEVKNVEVGINITSIQSDIKIKFVNKENNRLIANVPFEVEVKGNKGKAFNLKDEDKDGIIYQTGVDADTYTVKPLELKGEEFECYKFATTGETIKVTDTIAYKKVDVADEIKSESEVNAAAEDTAQQTQTESSLTDTVEWVESTKTEIESDENYLEINKSDIADPSTSAKVGRGVAGFMKLVEAGTESQSEEQTSDEDDDGSGGDVQDKPKTEKERLEELRPSLTPASVNIKKGESVSLIFKTEINASYILDWSSSNTAVACVEDNGTVIGVGAGSATVSATIKLDSSSSASVTLNCSVTVTEDNASAPTAPTYKMKSVTGGGNIKVGQTCTVSGTTEPEGGKITWSSSNTKIATVDANGVVTGVSTGTVSIIGTSESGDSKECSVTVEASEVTYKSVTITGSNTLEVGKSTTLKADTDPAGGSVAWSSDNEKVVKIDSSGNMTGVSAGSATITAACGSAKGTLKVTVTKGKDVSGDTKTKLKDKKGKQIYIKNSDGKFVEATYADYYKSSKFYLKSPNVKYRYTGWQTIDGYTYFFDKNGNYVTGEQVIQGAKYTFGSDGKLSSGSGTMGIDVSKHNGNIDWNAVKNSGVSFAIIRCGYRGSATGVLVEDPMFRSN